MLLMWLMIVMMKVILTMKTTKRLNNICPSNVRHFFYHQCFLAIILFKQLIKYIDHLGWRSYQLRYSYYDLWYVTIITV